MIYSIIFDMDGVLVDSEPLHYEADSEVFRALKIQVGEADRASFLGMGPEGVFDLIRKKYHLPQSPDELISLDNRLRLAYFRKHVLPPVPGLRDFLENLKVAGIPMAVASSSVRPLVEYLLEKQGLTGYFKFLVCGDEVPKTKPDPALFLLAASKLGIEPGHCLVIEDSPNGLKASRAAGMKCALFNPSSTPLRSSLQADFSFSTFVGLQVETLIRL